MLFIESFFSELAKVYIMEVKERPGGNTEMRPEDG